MPVSYSTPCVSVVNAVKIYPPVWLPYHYSVMCSMTLVTLLAIYSWSYLGASLHCACDILQGSWSSGPHVFCSSFRNVCEFYWHTVKERVLVQKGYQLVPRLARTSMANPLGSANCAGDENAFFLHYAPLTTGLNCSWCLDNQSNFILLQHAYLFTVRRRWRPNLCYLSLRQNHGDEEDITLGLSAQLLELFHARRLES